MRVVELTRTTPYVEAALDALRVVGLVLGVGTIADAAQVHAAAAAGARFVVSFTAPPAMIRTAGAYGLTAIPGALTPTEMAGCLNAGARVVKLFPARAVRPTFVRDMLVVLPHLRAMVSGGVAAREARQWLDAGAIAVGVGSEIGTVATLGTQEVTRRARIALEAASAA
jgi:2-dehydro-3-deoxyphosphogluconate aldolase/(4S)-4-hydroxy-2-oxoglutarate aldolase